MNLRDIRMGRTGDTALQSSVTAVTEATKSKLQSWREKPTDKKAEDFLTSFANDYWATILADSK